MFPHHPWEREGLCLDTIQHRVTSSSPLQQIPKVPDLNPALTCRQCMEAVGSSRGHQVSERRGRPWGATPPFHRSAEVRLGMERAILGQPVLAKYRNFCRPAKQSQDYCCLCLTYSGKEGKKTTTEAKSINTPVRLLTTSTQTLLCHSAQG